MQQPCPEEQIKGMVEDGVMGGTDNLVAALGKAREAGYSDSGAYAVAARVYNSGGFVKGNLGDGMGSTAGYVDGVMGRLVGSGK